MNTSQYIVHKHDLNATHVYFPRQNYISMFRNELKAPSKDSIPHCELR